jgi:hypothetical protein
MMFSVLQMGCGLEEEGEGECAVDCETTIKKGLLWQQRDKIFSRLGLSTKLFRKLSPIRNEIEKIVCWENF